MYTSYNRDIQQTDQASTKYTEYLRNLEDAPDSYDSGGAKRVDSRHQHHPLLPISDNEVKFSNIFSPHESNALKLQLLQKASSLPILDTDNARNGGGDGGGGDGGGGGSRVENERLLSTNNNGNRRRRSTASGVVHGSINNNALARKTDSVANILYSTIRHGHDYDNPSADETLHTGSDSKVDYDPHEPLPAVDQIALRHELLNNIRAISRATYFEDLYTGKVRHNAGSPEGEILRVLGNRQVAADEAATTIPSTDAGLSRVDRWVKESSEASRVHGPEEDKERPPTAKNGNSSLYHQSVWNEQGKGQKPTLHHRKAIKKRNGSDTTEGSYTESDVETASAYMQRTKHHYKTKFQPIKSFATNDANSNPTKTFSKNTDTSNTNIIETVVDKTEIIPGLTASTSQYLHAKYLGRYDTDSLGSLGKRRPFSFGYNSPDNLIPLSLSLPNVTQTHNRTNAAVVAVPNSYKFNSVSRPENLNYSTSSLSTKPPPPDRHKKRETNNSNNEQVRIMVQPTTINGQRGAAIRGKPDRKKVPGLYTRLHVNQWVVKKVWFYFNGDEHFPRFEYRFRQGKDIRDLDQLLDILTKRLPTLPTGARYIFTMDGYLINDLEEILNDQSYVASSTRKFKALKYGSGSSDTDGMHEVKVNSEQQNYPGGSKATRSNHKNSKRSNRDAHQHLNRRLSVSDGNLNSHNLARNPIGVVGGKKSVLSVNSNSVSDVVAHVITEASTSSSPLARQPIRVINGGRPNFQSQVLLNTSTSQPFDDLVRDLAASVRIPKQPLGNRLETLVGRHIQSYSQLRSELRAGQRAFYVYPDDKTGQLAVTYNQPVPNYVNHQRRINGNQLAMGNGSYRKNLGHKPVVKLML